MTSRRFLPLFSTQFLGAFNDNLLKNSIVILITYRLVQDANVTQLLVTVAAGLFILPFFIFSALAGQLADKFERSKLTTIIKFFEIVIMIMAGIGLISQNVWFLLIVLFACGTHSSFFGPIKYSLLPQQLASSELLAGNAYIEAGTFLAILLGTISGGLTILEASGEFYVSVALISIAYFGFIASRFIPVAPPPAPNLKINPNFFQETIKIIQYTYSNKEIFLLILCISWFWFIGATFLGQLAPFVRIYLQTESKVVTLFLTLFSIGIGIGSFVCTKLLHGKIRTTFVPLACAFISLFIFDLYIASKDPIFFNLHGLLSIQRFKSLSVGWRLMIDLLGMSIAAGIYIVPLYTMLQHKSDQTFMARIIAANNVFNALFMVLAVVVTLALLAIDRTVPEVFLSIGLVNLVLALYLRKHLAKL